MYEYIAYFCISWGLLSRCSLADISKILLSQKNKNEISFIKNQQKLQTFA